MFLLCFGVKIVGMEEDLSDADVTVGSHVVVSVPDGNVTFCQIHLPVAGLSIGTNG